MIHDTIFRLVPHGGMHLLQAAAVPMLAQIASRVVPQVHQQPRDGLRIKVLLADSTRMGCQLLRDALRRSKYHFDVLASVSNRSEVLEFFGHHEADIVVLSEDLEDGPYSGFGVLRELLSSYPKLRVILLLRAPTSELVVDAFRLGARGIFSRVGSCELLCKSIYAVHRGQIWVNNHELEYLLQALAKASPLAPTPPNANSRLGRREQEVANLVAEGMTNREIAERLRLTEHTVSNYLFRTYEKLGISSRVELVLHLFRQRETLGHVRS